MLVVGSITFICTMVSISSFASTVTHHHILLFIDIASGAENSGDLSVRNFRIVLFSICWRSLDRQDRPPVQS